MSSDRQQRRQIADRLIYKVLHDKYSPTEGYTAEEITKFVHDWEHMEPVQFGRETRFIQRRMGAIRHAAYGEVVKKLKEAQEAARKQGKPETKIGLEDIKPSFLPFARPEHKFVWKYFNAVKKPWIENVIQQLRHSADGLSWVSNLLDTVF